MGEVSKFGIGAKCTFVRLSGCNLRCYHKTMGTFCDTPEALDIKCGIEMSVGDIVERCYKLGNRIICLTGGEPLMQDCRELIRSLVGEGFEVAIETNGSIDIAPYAELRGEIEHISFVLDYKSASSGCEGNMIGENLRYLTNDDYLKFVLYDWKDYQALHTIAINLEGRAFHIAAGLFWGSEIDYTELICRLNEDMIDVYLNCQQHKLAMLYDANKDKLTTIPIPREL